jgi:hypothetical protein
VVNDHLEMVTEIIQGIIAVLLVGPLGAIAIIDVLSGKPFSEPATLAALAGVVATYYYGQRIQRRQQDVISTLTDKIVNGGTK